MQRNVHVYVAYRTILVQGWREICNEPPYEAKEFKQPAKKEWGEMSEAQQQQMINDHVQSEQHKEKLYEEKLAQKYSQQLQTAYVSEVAAVAFDFMDPEKDPAAALPADDTPPQFIHLSMDGDGQSTAAPALELLVRLHNMVKAGGKEPLSSKHVGWRGYDPRFLRLAARNQAARTLKDNMRRLYMPLYFQSAIFDWNSCVGAEKYGDSDVLMQQMKLREKDFANPVLNELSKTLQLFGRFGLAPEIDLRKLVK